VEQAAALSLQAAPAGPVPGLPLVVAEAGRALPLQLLLLLLLLLVLLLLLLLLVLLLLLLLLC
jgi:hypothetical protein